MYHSPFFFFQLATFLRSELQGSQLSECYSQQKDELMLVFLKPDGMEFCIRADLSQGVSILSFPDEPARSRSNSVSLFPEILAQPLEEVLAFRDDRLFRLRFGNGLFLSFKMYGQRSNLILHEEDKVLSVFNHHLKKDMEAVPLPGPLPASAYEWHPDPDELRRRCLGFSKRMWKYWAGISASGAQREAFLQMLETLRNPAIYFLCREENEAFVSFFPHAEILFESKDIREVSNRYYRLYWQVTYFEKEKSRCLLDFQQSRNRVLERIQLLEHEVLNSLKDSDFRLKADLLMAYGSSILPGLEKVSLQAFDGSGEVEILLKKDLSYSQNAERFYRKARGKQADLERIENSLLEWKEKNAAMLKTIAALEEARDLRSLRKLVPERDKPKQEQDDGTLPFHLLHFMDYEIRIGKNAKGNEELLRLSHKDDLWLHARDVPGSHVLVRTKKGQNIPRPVLERAAELAAFYSKAKNESLCPVMLTERKYVRKIKGAAAGMVKVEKEKTLLVTPKL
jgi:predicted ribosome quality control (RQC) complex YloA/Tae2 family protein